MRVKGVDGPRVWGLELRVYMRVESTQSPSSARSPKLGRRYCQLHYVLLFLFIYLFIFFFFGGGGA